MARLMVALVCSVLLLAGCTDDDPEPKFSPTPTVTPATTSATPTTSTPTVSPTPQPETAGEFVRRWVGLSNRATHHQAMEAYRQASRGCKACLAFADQIDGIYSRGGRVRGGEWTILELTQENVEGNRISFAAKMRSVPTIYMNESGAPAKTLDGGSFTEIFEVAKTAKDWRMSFIAERSSG